jgi:hypothetical protein
MAQEVRRQRFGEAGMVVVSVCYVGRMQSWAWILWAKAHAISQLVE